MKIVVNRCFGGIGFSRKLFEELGMEWDNYGQLYNEDFNIVSDDDYAWRMDKDLIAAIEKIGAKKASGDTANIEVVEIPDDVFWIIHDYDGNETIHEKHRSW